MVDVSARTRIERAPEDVHAYLVDPRHDPEWIGGIVEVHAPPGPVTVGTQVPRVATFMGRRVDYVLEVERLEEGLVAMRSVRAPFPMRVTYAVRPLDGASEVTLRVAGGTGGFSRLMGPVVSWQVRRNLRGDLVRLKGILER